MDNTQLREVIAQSVANMERLYQDIGRIMQITEEKMIGKRFKALGDTGVMWDSSSSLKAPHLWLPRYVARVYCSESTNIERVDRLVGYSIHLSNYASIPGWASLPPDLPVPLVAVSLVKVSESINLRAVQRTVLLNIIWCAGWHPTTKYIQAGYLRQGTDQTSVVADTVTYFVDMLDLIDEAAIERLVVEPMKHMYEGDEQYVNNHQLSVLRP